MEIVADLLRFGAKVDSTGMYAWSALIMATKGNHAEIVQLLLQHSPNVNIVDKDGQTALQLIFIGNAQHLPLFLNTKDPVEIN